MLLKSKPHLGRLLLLKLCFYLPIMDSLIDLDVVYNKGLESVHYLNNILGFASSIISK